MRRFFNLNCNFEESRDSRINPCVEKICSYPFVTGGVSHVITIPKWSIEYHYGYAGKIHFINPGAKQSIRRKKGMVHLYAPGCRFIEDTRNSEFPRQEIYMEFRGGEACGLERFTGETEKHCQFMDSENLIGNTISECFALSLNDGMRAFWEIQVLLAKCISLLRNRSRKKSEGLYEISSANPAADRFVLEVESRLRENIFSNVKNSELAAMLNLGESSFISKFKQKTGITPKARIMTMRIDIAKELLLKGRRLKEIAEFLGFYDEYHLSKTFKKTTGSTPRDFKKITLMD